MEEKIIIEGKYNYQFNVAQKMKIFLGIAVACGIFCIIVLMFINGTDVTEPLFNGSMGLGILFAVIAVVYIIIYLYCRFTKIVVTDKRVYGTTIGKQVDLPIDSISSVSTTFFLGVAVATASGLVAVRGVDNRDVIYKAINSLLIERQNKPKATQAQSVTNVTQEASSADELKKFKDLLDQGIISQEEFDAKKKQLLGL